MSLLSMAVRFAGRAAWQELEDACRDPRRAQQRLLSGILGANAGTSFGMDHGFRESWSTADFQGSVPIRTFEKARAYQDRVWNGEPKVLTNELPVMFSMTSGTTGKPKMLPVTRAAIADSRKLAGAWYYQSLLSHPAYLDGKILAVVGPEQEGTSPSGVPFGSASGRFYLRGPALVRRAYAIPYEAFTLEDHEAKYYTIARFGLEADVSFVGTPNPSTLVRIAEVIDENREELVKDIHNGTLSARHAIPEAARAALSPRLKPNRKRARTIEALMSQGKPFSPPDYWPRLSLMACWKGGSVGVQLERARSWFGERLPARDLGYVASEAHMSLPISDEGAAGVLAITANFFEFVPEEQISSSSPTVLLSDELQLGAHYYVILTTRNGLYRYDINDVVTVTGFFHRTPLIEFVRKGRDMTNIGGEKLHLGQIIEAFERSMEQFGFTCHHYRAIADAKANRYRFLLEWEAEHGPSDAACAKLLQQIDSSLRTLNIEYEAKRMSSRLGHPVLHIMRSGWHQYRVDRAVNAGAREVQFKPVLLSDSFERHEEQMIMQSVEWPAREHIPG
jgi:hypothetical protein